MKKKIEPVRLQIDDDVWAQLENMSSNGWAPHIRIQVLSRISRKVSDQVIPLCYGLRDHIL